MIWVLQRNICHWVQAALRVVECGVWLILIYNRWYSHWVWAWWHDIVLIRLVLCLSAAGVSKFGNHKGAAILQERCTVFLGDCIVWGTEWSPKQTWNFVSIGYYLRYICGESMIGWTILWCQGLSADYLRRRIVHWWYIGGHLAQ